MSIIIKKVDSRIPQTLSPLWRRLAFPITGLIVMITSLCYILYFSVEKEDPQTIPLIKAETAPYRVKPENPGGLAVAHQDKLVYERLSAHTPPEYEAQFTPTVEEPINVENLNSEKTITELVEQISVAPLSPVKPETRSLQTAAPLARKPVPVPSKNAVSKPVVKPTSSKNSQKAYRLQIASSRSSDILVKEWQRLYHLYPDILKNYQPIYLRLKEDTGIYYALRIGNFSNSNELKKLYQKLHQKKINCKIIEIV